MLIDRERIANDVYRGYAVVANGPFEPGSEQADPTVKPWRYDPDAGKGLLTQAGYADRNGDGVLDGPDGKPFRFTFTYSANVPQYERAVFLIKDSLARVGIAVDLDPQEWPSRMIFFFPSVRQRCSETSTPSRLIRSSVMSGVARP